MRACVCVCVWVVFVCVLRACVWVCAGVCVREKCTCTQAVRSFNGDGQIAPACHAAQQHTTHDSNARQPPHLLVREEAGEDGEGDGVRDHQPRAQRPQPAPALVEQDALLPPLLLGQQQTLAREVGGLGLVLLLLLLPAAAAAAAAAAAVAYSRLSLLRAAAVCPPPRQLRLGQQQRCLLTPCPRPLLFNPRPIHTIYWWRGGRAMDAPPLSIPPSNPPFTLCPNSCVPLRMEPPHTLFPPAILLGLLPA